VVLPMTRGHRMVELIAQAWDKKNSPEANLRSG
jgi:hypothetical protein